MSEDQKKQIDGMSYIQMLRHWRFAPVGEPLFQGEAGAYYAKVMSEKKSAVGHEAAVSASKTIGWDA